MHKGAIERWKREHEASPGLRLMPKELKPKPNLAEEERKLSPAPEDRQAHAAFLGQEGTGLFRIFPAELYEATKVISATDASGGGLVLAMEGGGGYYSFTKKSHEKVKWIEITLDRDQFRVGMNGASLSMRD